MKKGTGTAGRESFVFPEIHYDVEIEELFGGDDREPDAAVGSGRSGVRDRASEERGAGSGGAAQESAPAQRRGRPPGQSIRGAGRARTGRRAERFLMPALLGVLVLAGCTLAVVTAQMVRTGRQLKETQSKNEEITQQLEEIRQYMSSLGISVSDEVFSADGDYGDLSETVALLQGNLEEYRDSNEIGDEQISADLDGIIAELGQIQASLEEQDAEASEPDVSGTISGDSSALQAALEEQLLQVQEEIRVLLEEIADGEDDNYADLAAILGGTESDLDELAQLVAAGDSALRAAFSSGLDDVSSAAGTLQSTSDGIRSTLELVYGQNEEITEQLAQESSTLQLALVTLGDTTQSLVQSTAQEQSAELEESLSGLTAAVETAQSSVKEAVSGTESSLAARLEALSTAQGELTEAVSGAESALQSQLALLSAEHDELAETVTGAQTSLQTQLAALNALQTQLSEQLEALQLAEDSDQSELTASLTGLASGLSDLEMQLEAVLTAQSSLSDQLGTLTGLSDQLTGLSDQMSALTGLSDQLTGLSEQVSALSSLSDQLSTLQSSVDELTASLAAAGSADTDESGSSGSGTQEDSSDSSEDGDSDGDDGTNETDDMDDTQSGNEEGTD